MTSEQPLLSIITVTYNAELYLERTILSIISQKIKGIEYIIIDGGSDDETMNILKNYKNIVDVIISEKDEGIYDAMNKGARVAKGKWINFLNAGDTYSEINILSRINFQNYNYETFIYGSHNLVDEKGNVQFIEALDFNYDNLVKNTTRVLCHQSLFIKRDKFPLFDTRYKLKSELDQLFRLENENFEFVKVDFAISNFLIGGAGSKFILTNTKERLQVIYKWSNFCTLLKLAPFLIKGTLFELYSNKKTFSIQTSK